MINKEIYDFLSELKSNNNREWFHENKITYNNCKSSFLHTIEFLIHEISQFDKSVAGIQPKDCIFRINRDIRFSKDKSPYKSNFGAFIVPGGKKSGKAGYYMHIEPGNSFLAGGIYMPPSPMLKALRQEIYENFEEFLEIIQDPGFAKYFKEIEGDRLKTKPKGFPDDFEGMGYLKFKSFAVMMHKADKEFMEKDFFRAVMDVYKALYPFNRFLNNVEIG